MVNSKKVTKIIEEASFCPKRVFIVYYYYKNQLENLGLTQTELQAAIDILKQVLDIHKIPEWER